MKSIEGNCALCGEFGKLSFEHVPPQSAFNNKPIFVQGYTNLVEKESRYFGKRMKNNKGFGGYTLCKRCNNSTGQWYAKDFANFAQQGMSILKDHIDESNQVSYVIQGSYKIKPLNVLKQILAMFMSADKSGVLISDKELVNFILNKESKGIPSRYKVFLYSNHDSKKRMLGYSVTYAGVRGVQKWSEINFQPFGYLLADESGSAHKNMCDISGFGNYTYNEEVQIIITTPYLMVTSPWIGSYEN
jgi:hypothetical protein